MHSDASFDTAAKHLFRHLHEERALWSNPLVCRFFDETASGNSGYVRDRSGLDQVHQLVRDGADRCRDADRIAGREERALRQHAIIMLQCLEQRPIQQVAAELGISYRHCYRERADICQRVARYIYEYNDASTLDHYLELDEFELLKDQTKHRTELGDMNAAFRESEDLIHVAPSARKKIEALRVSALVSLHFGEGQRAEDAYASAQELCADYLPAGPSRERDWAQACVDLIGSKLACYGANTAHALRMAQRAVSRLGLVQANAPPELKELQFEALYELGCAFCNTGNLERGYDHISAAEANLRRVRAASSSLRLRITVDVWRLRNHLVMNARSWYPSQQRLKGLMIAFEEAFASRLVSEAIAALDALAEHHALARNDDECLRACRFAILLAKQQPNARIRLETSVRLAARLLWTRHWKYALSVLPAEDQLEGCSGYYRKLMSFVAACAAFESHAFQDADALTSSEIDYEKNVPLTVGKQLVAAAAAHALGRRRNAYALIEEAVPAAEAIGSAPTILDAYGTAATITGDTRLRRRADDLARLLTA
jgi:hypothetical protein